MMKLSTWVTGHKFLSAVLVLAFVGGGYYEYTKLTAKPVATQYTTATAEKGTLVVSVSGTGQVDVLNQIDVKPEVSGRIVSIAIHNGQYVSDGEVLGRLDTQDAEKAVRDAGVNLDSSNLQLSILKESGANVSTLVSNGYNEVANTFLDLPSIVTGLNAALHDSTIASYTNLVDPKDADLVRPLIQAAESSYADARSSYDTSFSDYHSISRSDPQDKIISFIGETSDTSTKIADAIKNLVNLIDFINDYNTKNNRTIPVLYTNLLTKYKTNLTSYTSQMNPHISTLSSIQSSITNAPLNIASQELSIKQRENALADAKDALQYYTIRAPFSGVIASTLPHVGDTASPSTVFATLISSSRYAGISLNEVDVSKIKLGQKATLTFDAIDGYSATGKVIEIDSIGTITQGVVTYNVKVGFDTNDARIKPGMSVTAAIITNVRQDVLLVPNAAVKTQGNTTYVELVSGAQNSTVGSSTQTAITTEQRTVVIGATNDTMTEIISGLNIGDEVVTRTITPTTQATTPSTGGGALRIPGLGGRGG